MGSDTLGYTDPGTPALEVVSLYPGILYKKNRWEKDAIYPKVWGT